MRGVDRKSISELSHKYGVEYLIASRLCREIHATSRRTAEEAVGALRRNLANGKSVEEIIKIHKLEKDSIM